MTFVNFTFFYELLYPFEQFITFGAQKCPGGEIGRHATLRGW